MKTQLHPWYGRSAVTCFPPALAFSLLLVTLSTHADTSFTNISWVVGVPVPGILSTNDASQVHLKGNVHVLRVESSEARVAGRLTAWMDLAYQADGTAQAVGPAYVEPGTWDAAGADFTPTGGVWDMKYTGVVQADGSDEIHMVGYGIGGVIEGLRIECTATKGAGVPFDPAIPYFASGMIRSAPVIVTETISLADATDWPDISPPGCLAVNNNQLTIHADWPGIVTHSLLDTVAYGSPERGVSVTPGHTLETRVDLVRLSDASAYAVLALYYNSGIGYWLAKAGDSVSLGKQTWSGVTFLGCDIVTTGNSNRVLSLAVTPSGQSIILTARVLDRDHGEAVVYQKSFTDTPASDPSLTAIEVQLKTGMALTGLINDPAGAPWTTFKSPWVGLFQYTDGTLPAAEATFEHFEVVTYEVPPIGIQGAVQLSWPDVGSYGVESAPTPQGPWLPLRDVAMPGFKQITASSSGSAEFYRLRQVP